jgi:hypothetical protein
MGLNLSQIPLAIKPSHIPKIMVAECMQKRSIFKKKSTVRRPRFEELNGGLTNEIEVESSKYGMGGQMNGCR